MTNVLKGGNLRAAELLERYALLLLTAAIFLFFALDPSTSQFTSAGNLRGILNNQAILGILVVATIVPLAAGHIDLSVGPAAGLSSVVCAGLMSKSGLPLAPAVAAAIATGACVGIANGLLVCAIGINSIVATLGTMSIIGAVVLWYTEGTAIVTKISPTLTGLGRGDWLGLPKAFWIFLVVALAVYYFLEFTPIGRYLYSVGASPRAATLLGLRVQRLGFGSFVSAGMLAGVAGAVLVGMQNGANPQLGSSYMLPTLAAVFLGATAITPGRVNVRGAVIAIFLLAISVNGLTLLGAEPWVSEMFNGVALLTGVGISVYSGRRRTQRTSGPAAPPPADEEGDGVREEVGVRTG